MVNRRTTAFSILITLSLAQFCAAANSSSTTSEEQISGIGGTGHQDQGRPINDGLNIPETTEIPEIPHTPEIPDIDLPETTPTEGVIDIPETPGQ